MKTLAYLPLLFMCAWSASAQDVASADSTALDSAIHHYSVEELLIQTAWDNNVVNRLYNNEVEVARVELKQARMGWLDNLSVSGNLNEFSINPPEDANLFFPRYNFAFGVSVGQLVGTKAEIKKAKSQLFVLAEQRLQDSLKLRSSVLRNFEFYKMTKDLFQTAEERVITTESELKLVERGFSDGSVDLATYTQVMEMHSEARSAFIKSKNEHMIAKINLEELIGTSLSSIGFYEFKLE